MSLFLIFWGYGCALDSNPNPIARFSARKDCAPFFLKKVSTDTGSGKVFLLDPIFSFKEQGLLPTSTKLKSYGKDVSLEHLSGEGVLKGKYLEVLNGLQCADSFGAFETENQFSYSHDDFRFQEVMTYYYGNLFRSQLDKTGYLKLDPPIKVIAHCELEDNAYFVRSLSMDGQSEAFVCLGDSSSTPGAFYADDPIVAVHEIQHGATMENYSPTENLGQLWYDEAGALNEAISDFMGLVFEDPWISGDPSFDPRIFSRWALGTFSKKGSHVRGAHRCPMYDSSYPDCQDYPKFAPPSGNRVLPSISYIYPDGVGWPFPNNFGGSNPLQEALERYPSQEEIHNAGMVFLGALWDAYEALKKGHSGDLEFAGRVSTQLLFESLRHLPMPNLTSNRSPVTFIEFMERFVESMALNPSITANDQAAVKQVLQARGLYLPERIEDPDWMGIGLGTNKLISASKTPGVYVNDDPVLLQRWMALMGGDPSVISQQGTSNRMLEPGEIAVVWFDIENRSPITAGGVLLTVTSSDPDIRILGESANLGYLSSSGLNQTQVMYGKVNGTRIASSLPVGNSYFRTNLFFNASWRNAVWIKVSADASHGKVVPIQVQASPANGITAIRNFELTIH